MRIRIGYEIAYDCPQPTPMLLMLSVHPSRVADLATPAPIQFDPPIPIDQLRDGFGNICTRRDCAGRAAPDLHRFLIGDTGLPDPVVPPTRASIAIEDLPDDALVFLLGSRYCETDQLSDTAWSAVRQHAARLGARAGDLRLRRTSASTFGYQHAAPDAHRLRRLHRARPASAATSRTSPSRFCRCMNIPARYCTGYLGDIGVPLDPTPMDFSAWFEAYLGGRWYTFDARHNKPRIGRILMAPGRDATDVAISNSFGMTTLAGFKVWTDELKE